MFGRLPKMRHISTNIGIKMGFFLRVNTHFYRGLYGFLETAKMSEISLTKKQTKSLIKYATMKKQEPHNNSLFEIFQRKVPTKLRCGYFLF
jgi:hypothetical protein